MSGFYKFPPVKTTIFDTVPPPSDEERQSWKEESAREWSRRARKTLNTEAARQRRPDALRVLIEQIVAEHPWITWRELLGELRKHERGPVIESIADDIVEWVDRDGRIQSAPISGLKDRLSRAKKHSL